METLPGIIDLTTTGLSNLELGQTVNWQFQYALFTYKTHIDKKQLSDFFISLYARNKLSINIVHETADKEAPYEHTHAVINFGKTVCVKKARRFDFQSIHPHIKKLPGQYGYRCGVKYITKEDPDRTYFDFDPDEECLSMRQRIAQCKSFDEVLDKFQKKPSDFAGLKQTWNHTVMARWKNIQPPSETLYEWQQLFVDQLLYRSDDRKIHWYYDQDGLSGKNMCARACKFKYPNQVMLLNILGTSPSHIEGYNYKLFQELRKGGTLEYIIINICRRAIITSEFYEFLEYIKDQVISCSKYDAEQCFIVQKCLIVFANFSIPRNTWTEDRLNLYVFDKRASVPRLVNSERDKEAIEDPNPIAD